MGPVERERLRARRFGFFALALWTSLGLALEAAHAFKVSAYLDHPLRREVLRWGHAHGVGLALLVLAFAALGIVDERSERYGLRLRMAATIIPLGFVLSVFGHGESDPGPSIWLVPVGGLLLVWALFAVAFSLPRAR